MMKYAVLLSPGTDTSGEEIADNNHGTKNESKQKILRDVIAPTGVPSGPTPGPVVIVVGFVVGVASSVSTNRERNRNRDGDGHHPSRFPAPNSRGLLSTGPSTRGSVRG